MEELSLSHPLKLLQTCFELKLLGEFSYLFVFQKNHHLLLRADLHHNTKYTLRDLIHRYVTAKTL